MSQPTYQHIREIARMLCAEAGHNPDQRYREYSRSSWDYWAWELFVPEARRYIMNCCDDME